MLAPLALAIVGLGILTLIAPSLVPGLTPPMWDLIGGAGPAPPPPGLVLQPQGQPHDHCRGGDPDVHGHGGAAGRHRPRRTVAQAGRGVSHHRRTL